MPRLFGVTFLLVFTLACGDAPWTPLGDEADPSPQEQPESTGEEEPGPSQPGQANPPSALPSNCLPAGLEMETLVALNLRAGPSLEEPVLVQMPRLAHPVTLPAGGPDRSCPKEGWFRLTYGDHEGWAYADYLVRADVCTRGTVQDGAVQKVISAVFGAHAAEALEVARCESGPWGTDAQNGQYLGLFQMGANERATYGHHTCAEGQARAAERYFAATNKTWSPWSCKP